VTIFYCLRFETSLFVASYDSQGHGGGIRPRLHTGHESAVIAYLFNKPPPPLFLLVDSLLFLNFPAPSSLSFFHFCWGKCGIYLVAIILPISLKIWMSVCVR
jgi:hypothetical protein